MLNFNQFNLKQDILQAISKIGFKAMTKIQFQSIALDLKKHSLMCQSPTGSGKTHAFLIPLFNQVIPKKTLQAIIISPTQELARQTYQKAKTFNQKLTHKINIKLLVKGFDKKVSLQKQQSNPFQVIIGTPGKINDLVINSPLFNLKNVAHLIIDEADMIFELDFINQINTIIQALPHNVQFKTYSATITHEMKQFIQKMNKVIKAIIVEKNQFVAKGVNHFLINAKHQSRIDLISKIIASYQPYLAIIFVNKKEQVQELVAKIKLFTKKVIGLDSSLPNRKRKSIINDVKSNIYQILVATDVAARGIDIKGVSDVFSLEIPSNYKYYIHRAGRTGRNNALGNSYLFYDHSELKMIDKIKTFNILFQEKIWKNNQLINKKQHPKSNKKDVIKDNKIQQVIANFKKKKIKPNYHQKLQAKIKKITQEKKKKLLKEKIAKEKVIKAKQRRKNLQKIIN